MNRTEYLAAMEEHSANERERQSQTALKYGVAGIFLLLSLGFVSIMLVLVLA